MLMRHVMGLNGYQSYVGEVAQHTAVHVGRAAEALAALIRSPDLRRRMGAAGRDRVREAYDWPVVARALQALLDELAGIRAAASDPVVRQRADPVRRDPFADFAGFATSVITLETRITATPGARERLATFGGLDHAFPGFRATPQECATALDVLASGPRTVRETLLVFPTPRRRAMELAIVWMAKFGLVDWLP